MPKLVNGQHLKALVKKNWIVYRRTPFISALEIVFPVLFMSIILIARVLIKPETSPEQSYLTPQYYDEVKVNPICMHYPFYDTNTNATKNLQYEVANYSFLGQTAQAFKTFFPGPCLTASNKRRIIGVFPRNNITQVIYDNISQWMAQQRVTYGYFQGLSVLYFDSEQAMLNYVNDPQYEIASNKPGLCMAISHYQTGNNNHAFKFHFDDQNDDNQNMPNQKEPAADPFQINVQQEDYYDYAYYGYNILQSWMANALLRTYTGQANATIVHMSVPMRSPPQETDQYSLVLNLLLPLCLVLMYILPINRTIGRIVSDKENRLRESMRMMGMSDTAYWLSWFIYYISISTTIALVTTIILCTKAIQYSNWGLVFLFLWLYGFSLFGYIIFVQAFFSKPRTASIIGTLIYFFTAFLDYAVQNAYTAQKFKTLASFLPTIAIKRACVNIAQFEQVKIGIHSSNLTLLYNNFQAHTALYMMSIFLVFGVLVGLYLTNILPSAEGLRLPWYYPVSPSYWCGASKQKNVKKQAKNKRTSPLKQISPQEQVVVASINENENVNDSINLGVIRHPAMNLKNQIFELNENAKNSFQDDIASQERLQPAVTPLKGLGKGTDIPNTMQTVHEANISELQMSRKQSSFLGSNSNFESVIQPDLLKQEQDQKILSINNLKKTFSNGFQAVKGLDVKMYNGQIFALLGHNGAGKTTTISMLTGLLSYTSGQAEAFGYDLFNEMEKVREFLGVCPQHDILFDLLSPLEHLEIFCVFKGVDPATQKDEILKMIKDVDLWSYKDTIAKNLSGGNRRKLSVAIALIGNSKLVLLDEPTAGMDLSARRKLWNMLKNYKNNKIIILTTHYMDEADILGDRIGIMSGGKLICLGSSLFLKNRFGVGYNVTMVKKSKEPNTLVGDYFEKHLGQVKKLHEVSSEITYQIPTSLCYKFKDFFINFDKNLDSLGIRSYGISVTTLEEVFLRVGSQGANLDELSNQLAIEQERPSSGMAATNSNFVSNNMNSTNIASNNLLSNNIVQKFESNTNEQKQDIEKQEDAQDTKNRELEDYCIVNQVEGNIMKIFFTHIWALFRKRFFIYRRNFKGLLIEIFIPVLLIVIGFAFAKIQNYYDSPARIMSPSLFPSKQRILVNSDLMQKSAYDITPQQLVSTLTSSSSAFEATYKNYSSLSTAGTSLIEKFDMDVYNQRKVGPVDPYRYGSYFVYEANNKTKMFKFASFVNMTSQDVAGLYPQFMYESILKQATGDPNFKFTLINAPFPVTRQIRLQAARFNSVFIVFVISIGLALIPASIISFILHEREYQLKHMQLISGMNLVAYWVSNYIFDTLKSLIPLSIVVGLIYAFDLNYSDIWRVLLMFPIGAVPFTYATSFFFLSENVAQSVTIFTHFVIGGIGAIVVFILRIVDSTQKIGDKLVWIFKIVPSFCVTNPIMFVSSKDQIVSARPDLDLDTMSIKNLNGDILLLGIHFIVWTLFLIIVEVGFFKWLWRVLPCNKIKLQPREDLVIDEDVMEEEQRVEATDKSEMRVRVNRFRKVYQSMFRKQFCAVERASFGLDYGECFALLGVNGAGKSTTFKSLTNDTEATSGEITINGMDVRKDFARVRKQIGYCPQHNAIFELMTVEEHLDYYARIKGIDSKVRQALVEKEIKDMNLVEHRNKPAGTLSGGNKRKLSVAMAVLGNPPIILLDEPSAGMDPEARRFMWKVVAKISQQRKHSAVILTTHSMEEAEALSTKMGIMVKGGIFKCFGSSQHIKNKFGTGYEIEVKVKKLSSDQVSQMTQKYQLELGQESISLENCIDIMRKNGVDEFLISEIKENGLGSDIYKEAEEFKGMVQVKNFLIWLNVEMFGQIIIKNLVEVFNQVEMLEHYNDYYKMRVARQEKSIGYVFGMIEDKKDLYGISEYSVSQTTLEQIFQTFAQLEIDAKKGLIFEKLPNGQIGVATEIPAIVKKSSLE